MDPSVTNLRGVIIVALGVVTTIVLLAIVPNGDDVSVQSGAATVTTLPVQTTVPIAQTTTTPGGTTPASTTPTTATTGKSGKGKSTTTTTTPFVATGRPVVKLGSTGEDVTALQQRLNALGYDAGTANGSFGAQTQTAVESFQKAKNLAADGVVGATTWAALATG